MKRTITYFLIIMIFLLFSASSWAWSEISRVFIEESLVERGLDKSLVQSMVYDSRISLRPDIVIQNLFYSSPTGTEEQPTIMRIDPKQIESGRNFIKEHKEFLSSVEKRFGTSPQIITAILIVESRLGTYPMPYNVVTAYTNLAFLLNPDYFKEIQELYADKYPLLNDEATINMAQRKAKWALGELYHLVYIANKLEIDPLSIMGSFAGALGPAQFIPSTFRNYGVDGDGDGIINPFNMKDANASIGHYLKSSGWSEDASLEKKRKAIWRYNRSHVYVNTIMMLYEELGKNEAVSQDFLPILEEGF
jgi:membrane-bound lytic murein transglycosylase B